MKLIKLAALCVVFLLAALPISAANAYSDEPDEDTTDKVEAEAVDELLEALLDDYETEEITETAIPETDPTPFTPDGTGTVVDSATDEDGKEFYTITTEAGNVFYLIIDNQRSSDNVYFLNAVTENDLLALAEPSPDTTESAIAETETVPVVELDTELEDIEAEEEPAEPEADSPMGMLLLVLAVVCIGGGAGYYFKIYRPKHEPAGAADEYEDDYSEYEDGGHEHQNDATYDDYDYDYDEDAGDDAPPWDVDAPEDEAPSDEDGEADT